MGRLQEQRRNIKSEAKLKGVNRKGHMEYWLTFWKKLEGTGGKSDLGQVTVEKKTEKGDGKWNDLSLWIGGRT